MVKIKRRITLDSLAYAPLGDNVPSHLVREWDGPLLPRKSIDMISPGRGLDIVYAKVKGHTVEEEDTVFIELKFTRQSRAYILAGAVCEKFLEVMYESGWKPEN